MAEISGGNRKGLSAVEPAQGYFDLGLYNDAWAALDELPPEDIASLAAISLRLDILLALHRLEDAVALGTGACRLWSKKEDFFLRTAGALIALDDYEKAKALLWAAPLPLRSCPAYWYDLAKCQARTGEVDASKRSLEECIRKDKKFRVRVLDDPDFEAVWKSL